MLSGIARTAPLLVLPCLLVAEEAIAPRVEPAAKAVAESAADDCEGVERLFQQAERLALSS